MIRKIIAQGKGAHTITLPSKWINMNHLKSGNEVNIIEKDADLIITVSSKQDAPKMTAVFNCKGVHWLIGPLVAAYYKRGYDELRVEYQTSKELEKINWVTSQLPGFEVVEKRSNSVLIKRIASASVEEYKNSIRRSCFTLKVMSEEFMQAIEKNDRELLRSVVSSDDNLNKFTSYARHIMFKDSSVEPVKAPPMYTLLWLLEKIGDIYKRLAQVHGEKKIKLSKETTDINKKINTSLADFLDLIFKYDQEKLSSWYSKKKQMLEETEALLMKSRGEETWHLTQLKVILSFLFDSAGLLAVINV